MTPALQALGGHTVALIIQGFTFCLFFFLNIPWFCKEDQQGKLREAKKVTIICTASRSKSSGQV